MSLIVMYILKCLDIIQQLNINQTGVDIFRYYQPDYQVKDLYKQTIVVSAMENDGVPWAQRALTFPARFPNIFVDYPLGQMRVGDKLWTNWNKTPTVKPRKEEPRKLRTNRLFLKILHPLVKNQCQGVFE